METPTTATPEDSSAPLPDSPQRPLELAVSPLIPFWKRLVRCNPFYLLSAVLLIFGAYRASVDPHFFSTEARQLIFNFGSMQLYGLMLLFTALFLARRKIFYDATLLVFIENVLVLIPLILVSQAIFLSWDFALTLSTIGFALILIKFTSFKRWFGGLNLPVELLVVGVLILLVNTAIPLVFRKALDTHNEFWTVRSQYCWYLLLPLLVTAGHLLAPLSARATAEPAHEHRKDWLPLSFFLLWISGTVAHFYSVGYIDDQQFELAKFSVLAWATAWLLCAKITLRLSNFTQAAPELMLSLPIAAALLAIKRPGIAVTLCLLNALIFGILCYRWSAPRIPAILGGISVAVGFFITPDAWITPVISNYSKGAVIFALVNTVLVLVAIKKRTAKWSILGALCMASLILAIGQKLRFEQHLAVQAACSFFFITSLFWKGPQVNGHLIAAIALGTLWTVDTCIWQAEGFLRFVPPLTAAPLLVLSYCLRRAWLHIVIATIIILAAPLAAAGPIFQKTPAGLLAVGASFVLFGVGTAFAIWKRKLSDVSKGIEGMSP